MNKAGFIGRLFIGIVFKVLIHFQKVTHKKPLLPEGPLNVTVMKEKSI